MKTNTVARNVITEAGESSMFTVANSSKVFRILIDGLYADKIQSITREIWSNALDSHVQAGKADVPFEVAFPSVWDATFRVRDYGVGLSHDMVMHLYTNLGESTKEDTNDAVGKFGIGSKTPFAYTDNFTVTTYSGSETRFYSAMIGADGVPAIHLMGTEPSDEPCGVEVAFPVNKADVNHFRQAAKRVSLGFDVKPTVSDADFEGWPEFDVEMRGPGFIIPRHTVAGIRNQAYARMGPVLYPINREAMDNHLTADENAFLRNFLIMDFAMGELEITTSREELSYGRNDPTIASITRRIRETVDTLSTDLIAQVAACDTYVGACAKAYQIGRSGVPSAVKSHVNANAEWNGRKIVSHHRIDGTPGMNLCYLDNPTWGRRSVPKFKGCGNIGVPVHKKHVFLLEDQSPGTKKVTYTTDRVRKLLNDRQGDVMGVIWMRVFDSKLAAADILKATDALDYEVIHLEDLEKPAHVARPSSGTRRPVMARDLTKHFDSRVSMDDEVMEEGGFYLPMYKGSVDSTLFARYSVPATVERLRKLGYDVPTVYGIPQTLKSKASGDQWVNFEDFVNEVAADLSEEHAKAAGDEDSIHAITGHWNMYKMIERTVDSAGADKDKLPALFQSMLTLLDDAVVARDRYLLVTQFYGVIGRDAPDPVETDLGARKQAVDSSAASYPLLPHIVSNNDISLDMLTDYVFMCDTLASKTSLAA